jgi:hypothetical protein
VPIFRSAGVTGAAPTRTRPIRSTGTSRTPGARHSRRSTVGGTKNVTRSPAAISDSSSAASKCPEGGNTCAAPRPMNDRLNRPLA